MATQEPADNTVEGLKVWIHPAMSMPFSMKDCVMDWKPKEKISKLMERIEDKFEAKADEEGKPVELQINVLWNIKDHKKALNPSETIGAHFEKGETCGVYGDIFPREEKRVELDEGQKTPVVILTGFLGSGKTTLLNYILHEQRDKKIAIIENEFGDISIDDALLQKDNKVTMAEKIVVMDNGCMCCTIREDLVQVLQHFSEEAKKGTELDAILIETTGMADPVPIVRTFMANPDVTEYLRLDGVLAMADVKHLDARLDDDTEEGKVNVAFQQIAFADKIILNKLDLVSSEEAIATKQRIREVNSFAKVLPAVRGRVKLEELWNMRAHDMENFVNLDIEKEAEVDPDFAHGGEGGHDENCTEEHGGHGGHGEHGEHGEGHGGHGGHEGGHDGGHDGGHGDGHGDGPVAGHIAGHGQRGVARHDGRVHSFSIVREGEILPRRLSAWIQSLGCLPQERGLIFRIKAILAVKDHPYKHVFHAVMDVSDEVDAGEWGEDEPRISKIVFIGKSLDQAYLREGFHTIFEQLEQPEQS